jgi:lambda family phage portal protein
MADGHLPAENPTDVDDARDGALMFRSQKGSIDILPRGTKLVDGDPNYPSDTFPAFVHAALRGVASGGSVSYESLSNDRNGVTWTSIRHAVLDERDHWMILQDWFVQAFSMDMATRWMTTAFLSPFKPFDYLPAGKLAKFLAPEFYPRRWDWVNPKDDIEAEVTAIANKLTSHRRVLAKRGIDLEELLTEITEDNAMAAALGVDLAAITLQNTATKPKEPT